MKRTRRVKIVATIGPATDSIKMIKALFYAGADVFRINMSHTSHEDMRELHDRIRDVEKQVDRPIGILCDLQGPKLRIGNMEKKAKVKVKKGEIFRFDLDETSGDKTRVYLPHKEIIESVKVGDALILDDGKLRMEVVEHGEDFIHAKVIVGGKLSGRKGVSLPDTLLPFSAMTDKDRSDLKFAISVGVDWIALSFVQRVGDVIEARELAQGKAAIMAKIEKPSAITELDDIIQHSDGLMIARGDLGVEMPLEQVPGLQKRILRSARQAGKPVVVATQMLESMIEAPVPTRAEVSDVATAVFEGADAVMLSAESAVGEYPVEAVETMDKVAIEVEQDRYYNTIIRAQSTPPEATSADAISAACRSVADTLDAAAILSYTATGSTALRAARERPRQPILALTPIADTSRRMALIWGIHCVLTKDPTDLDDMVDRACRIAYREGFARPGQRVVITSGVPLGTPGATNMLRVAYVGGKGQTTI
jgi:pyruvate kinase